ncbi:hypothetical protein QCA50_004237 [Cerrena zonata]|uniref:rRNA adenine N(6)-methyltransferase n=1 Tax=Cerrena zonata TaxID=2478898 RepID=A0AAW0GTJ9_9APHY
MRRSLLRIGTSSLRASKRTQACTTLKYFRRRFHDTNPLPPEDEWRTRFPSSVVAVRDRVSVRVPDTASLLAEGFLEGKSIAAGDNKVIIEVYPGPGALSRALLHLSDKRVKRLIILEPWKDFYPCVKSLEEADPRVTVLNLDGYVWDSYQTIEDQGLLKDVVKQDWNAGVHPQLHFICQMPNTVHGEQFLSQIFRCIPTRSWLFQYGRVPMSLILNQAVADRLVAPHSSKFRGKVAVLTEATADVQFAVRPSQLEPYDDHFHPVTPPTSTVNTRRHQPHVALNVVPYEQQLINIDEADHWDYVLRRLFVLKSTPLKKAISNLAPGAQSLLKILTDVNLPLQERVNVDRKVKELSIKDWALIVRAFKNWPFAPDDLTFINVEGIIGKRGNGGN